MAGCHLLRASVSGTIHSRTRTRAHAMRGRPAIFALVIGGWMAVALSSVQTLAPSERQRVEGSAPPAQTTPVPIGSSSPDIQAALNKYCVTCHSQRLRTAGLVLEGIDEANPAARADLWERVIAKLRARSMPPAGMPRPDAATYRAIATSLEAAIDRAWAANPNPGRIGAVHRLNRVEYNNAIRDLFALDIDVTSKLPGDETADGSFDNFADVLSISTAHLERYLSVGRQVTRLAVGLSPRFRRSSDSRFPCMSSRTISRAKTCRWDRAVAWRFAMTFRLMASTRSRFACDGSIRTTSWAWAGHNSSTSASMARW